MKYGFKSTFTKSPNQPASIYLELSLRGSHSERADNESKELIICDDCGKRFKQSILALHRRRVHKLLKQPIECCGQELYSK